MVFFPDMLIRHYNVPAVICNLCAIIIECGGFDFGNGEIASPFFPHSYPMGRRCVWQLLAYTSQQAVEFDLQSFDIPESPNCTEVSFVFT